MFVSFINLGIILVSNRYNEKIIKVLNLLLVIFTIIIAISSMYRMNMYETEYGLTYLRVFVYLILIAEIISFVPIIIYIFNKNFDFLKWCFLICVTVYCIANYMNIEKIIVNKNINGTYNQPVDYYYISRIASEDSFDILEQKANTENLTNEDKLDILNIMQKILSNIKTLSWQEFNISKYNIKKNNTNNEELTIKINELNTEILEQERINNILSQYSKNYK